MGDGGNRWKGWLLASAFPVVFIILTELKFELELEFRYHTYFLSSNYHQRQLVIFILSMILIPGPLVVAILESLSIEKKMRSLGADENSIGSLWKSMGSILGISYMILMLCVGSMSDLLPLP